MATEWPIRCLPLCESMCCFVRLDLINGSIGPGGFVCGAVLDETTTDALWVAVEQWAGSDHHRSLRCLNESTDLYCAAMYLSWSPRRGTIHTIATPRVAGSGGM